MEWCNLTNNLERLNEIGRNIQEETAYLLYANKISENIQDLFIQTDKEYESIKGISDSLYDDIKAEIQQSVKAIISERLKLIESQIEELKDNKEDNKEMYVPKDRFKDMHKCACCGKLIDFCLYDANQYAYKKTHTGKLFYYCGYNCMNKGEKEWKDGKIRNRA